MLSHIKLLIFDLDFLVFDAILIKQRALQLSLIPMADAIQHHVSLPDSVDVEASFLEHGHPWIRGLDLGLEDEDMVALEAAYQLEESRILASGEGSLFPGIEKVLAECRRIALPTALGAESTRDYLLNVSDRHNLDSLFGIALSTAEYGGRGADEMIDEIMCLAQVHPSETIAFGTRPAYFRSARGQDVVTVGCGWGLQRRESLSQADLQCLSPGEMMDTIVRADRHIARHRM